MKIGKNCKKIRKMLILFIYKKKTEEKIFYKCHGKGQRHKNMISQKVALKCMTDVSFYL